MHVLKYIMFSVNIDISYDNKNVNIEILGERAYSLPHYVTEPINCTGGFHVLIIFALTMLTDQIFV